MDVFVVVYMAFDKDMYYGGYMNCMSKHFKCFSSHEKAEKFVMSELKEIVSCQEIVVKRAGEGVIVRSKLDDV